MSFGKKCKYENVPVAEQEVYCFDPPKLSYGYGYRHVQIAMLFLTVFMCYVSHSHLSVTIVAMTSTHNITGENSTSIEDGSIFRTYDWPKSVQEIILSSKIIGIAIMVFPMGMVVQRWGAKRPLQVSLFFSFLLSMPIPWLAAWGGWQYISAVLLVQGMFQATLNPAVISMLAAWVPISERAKFTSYVYTGTNVGTVVAFQLSGLLSSSRFKWPSVFWACGILSLITFIIFTIFSESSPEDHNYLSEEEKKFILEHSDRGCKKRMAPWKSIFKSKITWPIFVAHVGSSIIFSFTLIQVPTYMHNILKFNIRNSGLLASLPNIVKIFMAVGFGYLSDFCTNRNILTIKLSRIICNSIGQLGVSVCLAVVTFAASPTWAVVIFITSLGLFSAVYSGYKVNYIDVAPNYSASLIATGNTLSQFSTLVLPIIVSAIIVDLENIYQWRLVFLIIAAIGFGTNFFYALFTTSDIQPWNNTTSDVTVPEENEKKEEKFTA